MARRTWYTFSTREAHLSRGVNDAWWITHRSLGRENSDDSPYLIPNEWICSTIAAFLKLPVPAFALVRKRGRKGMFASLKFTTKDTEPPDAIPGECVKADPRTCAGILLFDILVANADRHSGNVAVEDQGNPGTVRIFDHDRALFGVHAGRGIERLDRLRDRLGCSGGEATGENEQCFIREIKSDEHFGEWVDRIGDIPDWFIGATCHETVGIGATKDEALAAVDFLKYRRDNLGRIITDHRGAFAVTEWRLFL